MPKSCRSRAVHSGEETLAAMSEPLVVVDARGRIVDFNSAAGRLLPAGREHALGQDFTRFFPGRTADLEKAVAELESFSYSLSHDLRAPLRAIRNFTELVLLDHEERLGSQAADYLKTVIRSAERLDRLAQDVLCLARINRQDIPLEPVDVERLVRGIVAERTDLQTPRAEITIHSPMQPALANETSLLQCFSNLLGNAVKFVAPGIQPRVVIRSENLGGWIRFWVEDNGIGIEKEAHARIFDLFQRHKVGGRYEGSGLGLAIVRKAVERMGGRVGLESEPGRGSRFWIQLPPALGAVQAELPL